MKKFEFEAHKILSNGLTQTLIIGFLDSLHEVKQNFLPRKFISKEILHTLVLADGDKLTLIENSPRETLAEKKPCLIFIHGLGSSARAPALQRMARTFSERGHRIFRLNHRGVAEGQGLSRGIYHAARTLDLAEAIAFVSETVGPVQPIIPVGFSLSGNMLLAHAGKSALCLEPALPKNVAGILSVCPVIDLASSSQVIMKLAGGIVDKHFTRQIYKYVTARKTLFPNLENTNFHKNLTLYDLDETYVSINAGFADALAYYEGSSAAPYLAHIKTPTAIFFAKDDPINKTEINSLPKNPYLKIIAMDKGGHLGFYSHQKNSHGHRFWLDWAIEHEAMSLFEKFV